MIAPLEVVGAGWKGEAGNEFGQVCHSRGPEIRAGPRRVAVRDTNLSSGHRWSAHQSPTQQVCSARPGRSSPVRLGTEAICATGADLIVYWPAAACKQAANCPPPGSPPTCWLRAQLPPGEGIALELDNEFAASSRGRHFKL